MRSQHMSFDMSLALDATDACPICSARIRLTEVEPHPNRHGLEIHGYSCESCGPVKFLVVMHRIEEEPPLLRLM